MNENVTIRRMSDRKRGATDFAALERMSDDDIAAAVATDPDAAPLDLPLDQAKWIAPLITFGGYTRD